MTRVCDLKDMPLIQVSRVVGKLFTPVDTGHTEPTLQPHKYNINCKSAAKSEAHRNFHKRDVAEDFVGNKEGEPENNKDEGSQRGVKTAEDLKATAIHDHKHRDGAPSMRDNKHEVCV